MSSPPKLPTSPPQKLQLSIPKKRPASFPTVVSGGNKRRNLSTSTTNSHPLRQTSFPPPERISSERLSLSPAIEESLTCNGSVAGSSIGVEAKRRNKKRRAKESQSMAMGELSVVKRSTSYTDGKGSLADGVGDSKDDDELDEEEGDGNLDTVLEEGGKMDEAEMKQEKEHFALLMNAFNSEQADRYDVWRRVRLKKETVRKITNQTLSQSVPASIVTTINGYTKLFIGDIIERARSVQSEWLIASLPLASNMDLDKTERSLQDELLYPRSRDEAFSYLSHHRGPLFPAHLREALRRYKKDREGGGVGFHGISLEGTARVVNARGGKRLFK